MKDVDTKQLKHVAKLVAANLKDLGYGDIKHTHMLSALSKASGFAAWNAIAASASTAAPQPSPVEGGQLDQPVVIHGLWKPGATRGRYNTYGLEVVSDKYGTLMYEYTSVLARYVGLEQLLAEYRDSKDGVARQFWVALNMHDDDDICDYEEPELILELEADSRGRLRYQPVWAHGKYGDIVTRVFSDRRRTVAPEIMWCITHEGFPSQVQQFTSSEQMLWALEMLLKTASQPSQAAFTVYIKSLRGPDDLMQPLMNAIKAVSVTPSTTGRPGIIALDPLVSEVVVRVLAGRQA